MTGFVALVLAAQEPGVARTGKFTDDYKDPKTQQLIMHYVLETPAKLPEQKTVGLIMQLHGMGGNETHLQGGVVESLKRVGILDQYIVAGLKSKGPGWTEKDDEFILKFQAWLKATYPIDNRRVFLVGMSNGGWMVKRFGYAHQDLFAGVVNYCGGYVPFLGGGARPQAQNPAATPAATKTEWYFVHGDQDKAVSVDASRKDIAELRQLLYRYIYRELAGQDHGSIWGVNEVRDDAMRWIHGLRHKEIPPSASEKKLLSTLVDRRKAEGQIPEIARIGGQWGGKFLASVFDSKTPEIRVDAVKTVEQVSYGREIVLELIKLVTDKDDKVRQAAIRALGTEANWRYPEAQSALVQIASGKVRSLTAEDRVLAVQGIVRVVKLMMLGNMEDKFLLWALVALLDDKELSIRQVAFEGFQTKEVPDSFGYKPDLGTDERKAPVAKWRKWLADKIGLPPAQPY